MNPQPEADHDLPDVTVESLPPAPERFTAPPAATDCTDVPRAWDLHPGDALHGRTIVAVRGEVGLGSVPVAVLSLAGDHPAHPAQTRLGAARPDTEYGCDDVWYAARAWVRENGLHEGDAVDLDRLRTETMSCIACPGLASCPRATLRAAADTGPPSPEDHPFQEKTPPPGTAPSPE
ncbi:hypothetical protein GCM10011374_38860 [Kocuria dechangensis]|uniref:Uncharacterized protein n=1 Tax=Kocuria dechangensis TaxID=1176249 RepID=A0A917H7V8_9MICC|nr:hypothetical protein [Kocuria dechangensis]GGG70517.1 hypothetical protein GCM10011374_38860 [Kocuria dechangensis]